MTSTEKRIFGITILGHAMCHVYMLIFAAALLSIQQSLKIGLTQLTSIGTICYLLFGLGALPSGILATKTNAKFTLKLFFLFSALASCVTGLSNNRLLFAAGLASIGLFGSLYHVSGLTLITQGIQKIGRSLGIHGVAGSAGIALTPLISGFILSILGWREIYLIMAIPGILGFLFLQLEKKIPSAHIESHPQTTQKVNASHYPTLLFILAIIAMGMNGFVYRGFLTILPAYITNNVMIGSSAAYFTGGIITTMILSVGMLGQYAGGHLSDRMRLTKLYLFFIAMSLPFLLLMGLTNNFLLIIMAVLFSLFHFPGQPIENYMISALIPPKLVSSGYGIQFFVAFGIGSCATVFAGYISEHYTMSAVFIALSFILLISLASVGLFTWFEHKE